MKSKPQNKQGKTFINQNPIESLKGIGQALLNSTIEEVGADSLSDLWNQLLGVKDSRDQSQTFGDISEGQEIDLRSFKKKEKSKLPEAETGIDYKREILQRDAQISAENAKVLKFKIEEILAELRQIAKSSQEIAAEFKEITTEQRIEKPGDYHLNFFQWMLSVVKSARMKIEDSAAWLSLMKSKKNKKNYWAMFKKYGTTFGLSNERVVATQTG